MRLIAPIRSNVFRHALVGLAFVTVSACNTAEPTAPNVVSPDALASPASLEPVLAYASSRPQPV